MFFMKKKFSKSTRKYIRKEKSRIRREVLDRKKQEELIIKLYHTLSKPKDKTKIIKKEANDKKVKSSKNVKK